jgi:hypothetical protein
MRSCTRVLALSLIVLSVACAACGGGGPRSQTADVLAISQPTPDATLDAVVRDLPRALAGVPPTPTPTPVPVAPKPAVKQSVATPALPVQKPAATVARPAATVARPVPTPSRGAPVASPVRR